MTTLVAEFTQIGADGRRLGGTLYLQRPGRLRFDYDAPATMQVIADGSNVAVRDRKLATQDLYFIAQTPLKFLLRERVNLGEEVKVTACRTRTTGCGSCSRIAPPSAAPRESPCISTPASRPSSSGGSQTRRVSRRP
jgi:outer membrane lipoprotein-sorting protein